MIGGIELMEMKLKKEAIYFKMASHKNQV